MINHHERQKLVKPSPNADNELTANDSDDDEHVYVDVSSQIHNTTPSKYICTFFRQMRSTILAVLITCIIGYLLYQSYAGRHSIDHNTYDNEPQQANDGTPNINSNIKDVDKSSISLAVKPIDFTQKSVAPKLPGIYLMNKAYNLLKGQQIYEQSGVDIISYRFNDIYTTDTTDNKVYEIPVDFRGIPNIEPSCSIVTKVHDVYHSTSTHVLQEQSDTSKVGFQAKVDLSYSATVGAKADGVKAQVKATAKTQMKFGLMFGHTSSSLTARQQASKGFSHSFSLDTANTYYKAEIDWEIPDVMTWKSEFNDSIKNLNKLYTTNQTILLFINDWGSHVLTKMQTGSYCKETAYMKTSSDESSYHSFQQSVSSESFNFAFFHQEHDKTSKTGTQTDSANAVDYEFSDIYCVGEVAISSKQCASITSTSNNPVVTSYASLLIFDIPDVQAQLNQETRTNISTFFDSLFDSLQVCADQVCNGFGVCSLDENIWSRSFINQWDGKNFRDLWNDDERCFCDDEHPFGPNCGECTCIGDTDCCCKTDYTCFEDALCSNQNFRCVAQDNERKCGTSGQFITCDPDKGVVMGVCASGTENDCGQYDDCGKDNGFTGIQCGYAGLGTITNTNENNEWICTKTSNPFDGTGLSCNDKDTYGSILIGICGSGGTAACENPCEGGYAILCGEIPGISVDWSGVPEKYFPTGPGITTSSEWGRFVGCGDGYVATGFCSSGADIGCSALDGSRHSHIIECRKLKYNGNFNLHVDNMKFQPINGDAMLCDEFLDSGLPDKINKGTIKVTDPSVANIRYRITQVQLTYQYSSGYGTDSTPNGATFEVSLINSLDPETKYNIYNSDPFTDHSWDECSCQVQCATNCGCQCKNCYSPIQTETKTLDIPANNNYELVFTFKNNDRNIQILKDTFTIGISWKT